MGQPHFLIFENSFKLTNFLIKKWYEIAQEAIAERGRFTIALSGGRSPVEFYCRLAGFKDFDLWQKTHIFLVDERYVPPTHPDSNFRLLKETFLDEIYIPPVNVHPMPTNLEDMDAAARQYEKTIQHVFKLSDGDLPAFDLIMLGIGEDGHTASLFPNHPEVDEKDKLVVSVPFNPIKYDRLSLTLPVINNAKHIFAVAQGPQKAAIVKHIQVGLRDFPITRVHPSQGELVYLFDSKAARNISFLNSYTHQGDAISV